MANSKLEKGRKSGKHQVDEQRESILDAAEKLFLQNGLENTTMVDIATQSGITKITLYRYFPNRDEIALAIHVRMLHKINTFVVPQGPAFTLDDLKKRVHGMIVNFNELRDAYRLIGMFDKLYLDNPPETALTQWTKGQLALSLSTQDNDETIQDMERDNRVSMILNTVIWFLEKLALRGELTWSSQDVPMEVHLQLFEEMIMMYIDQLMQAD